MKFVKFVSAILVVSGLLLMSACTKSDPETPSETTNTEASASSTLSTSSINAEGKLLTVCAASYAGGNNESPQLSWEPVDGATRYAIYMYDSNGDNWLHFRATDLTETSYEQGYFDSKSYIGPYPPSGNHTYVITVYALKQSPDKYKGMLDNTCSIHFVETALDTAGGEAGNIISIQTVSVDYANGDNNV